MFSKNAPTPDKRRRAWSLATRLAFLYAAFAFALLAGATGFLLWVLSTNLDREDNDLLADKVHVLRSILAQSGGDMHEADLLREEVQWEATSRRFAKFQSRILDAHGHVLIETPGMNARLPLRLFPAPVEASQEPQSSGELRPGNGKTYRIMAAWAQLGADRQRRTVQVALDRSDEARLMSEYRLKMLYVLAAGLLLSAALGYGIARRGMRPVEEMARALRGVGADSLHRRIAANGWPSELSSLAHTFDAMLQRLEESFERLGRFSADIAHEMRTPLGNLRGESEVALSRARSAEEYRQVIESGLEEYSRLARMIDSLLFIARAEDPSRRIERATLDARAEIEAVREYHEAVAEEQGVEIHCEGDATLSADATLFRRVISNLLSNALQYTGRGGKVIFHIEAEGDGGALIRVRDTGCGIAPQHLPRLFDRFYRADAARTQGAHGTGLGLAIVQSIMKLHGGTVAVESTLGAGTTVTLRFPAPSTLEKYPPAGVPACGTRHPEFDRTPSRFA